MEKWEKGLRAIEKLDIKRREYSQEADAIQSTMPIGQPYPSFLHACDKVCKLAEKQAKIWNDVRHYVICDGRTLWQIAIREGLVVHHYGNEHFLHFYGSDLREVVEKCINKEARRSSQAQRHGLPTVL